MSVWGAFVTQVIRNSYIIVGCHIWMPLLISVRGRPDVFVMSNTFWVLGEGGGVIRPASLM